jgi:hypothetical protein
MALHYRTVCHNKNLAYIGSEAYEAYWSRTAGSMR